jgi:hypothetical protein
LLLLLLLLLLFLLSGAAASAVMERPCPDFVAKEGHTLFEDGPLMTNAVDTVETTAIKRSCRTIKVTMMRRKE